MLAYNKLTCVFLESFASRMLRGRKELTQVEEYLAVSASKTRMLTLSEKMSIKNTPAYFAPPSVMKRNIIKNGSTYSVFKTILINFAHCKLDRLRRIG